MNDEKYVDWYHPTVLLSTLTSRRQRIISIWYSAPSSSSSAASAPSSFEGNGKQFVTSSVDPMSSPSSWPVTNAGSALWQCLMILSATSASISTTSATVTSGMASGADEAAIADRHVGGFSRGRFRAT